MARDLKDETRHQRGHPRKRLAPSSDAFYRTDGVSILNFCTGAQKEKRKKKKKTLAGQAVFLTSLTEAAHQMKGMCEIAFPSISVSMLRTLGFMRRMDHAAPSDVRGKKPKRVVIPHELASAIVQYDALRDDYFHAGCMCVNLQLNTQREGNRGGPVTSKTEHQSVT